MHRPKTKRVTNEIFNFNKTHQVSGTTHEQHDVILDLLQLLQPFLFQQFYEFSP